MTQALRSLDAPLVPSIALIWMAVMEAMKMEHTIYALQDGTIAKEIYVPGEQVAEGADLLRLAAG